MNLLNTPVHAIYFNFSKEKEHVPYHILFNSTTETFITQLCLNHDNDYYQSTLSQIKYKRMT